MLKQTVDNSPARTKPPSSREPWWAFSLVLTLLLGLMVYLLIPNPRESSTGLSYSEFLAKLEQGELATVVLKGDEIFADAKPQDPTGTMGQHFRIVAMEDPGLVDRLRTKNVRFSRELSGSWTSGLLSWLLPLIIFYGFWSFIFRRAAGSQTGILAMTKSKARVYMEKDIVTTFADVAGIDEAKAELEEVVNFLREPARFARLGGRMPKGVLLVGPPGTGKTLLARAIAGEAGVPFFSINGSEFVEMYVGLGAARVRDLFQETQKNAPCILFIDEIDALGKSRALGMGHIAANDEKEQTLNQLLAEMDGFDPREGVILLAATNRPEILDPALLRAGRFDRQVLVALPDQAGRRQILNVHLRNITAESSLAIDHIAALTPGFSGADLANLVNEAALVGTRRGADAVSESDFTVAIERIVAGLEQRSRLMNPDERRRIAVHEMGHATVALSLGTTDRVHKISIIPRGMGALGYTLRRPTEDRYVQVRSELLDKLAVLLAGRAAECEILGEPSTGAADDLAKATSLARSLVTTLGMSTSLGLAVTEEDQAPLLAPNIGLGMRSTIGAATADLIAQEIRQILDDSYAHSIACIRTNRSLLDDGVSMLLKSETLDEAAITELCIKHPPKKLPTCPHTNPQGDLGSVVNLASFGDQ